MCFPVVAGAIVAKDTGHRKHGLRESLGPYLQRAVPGHDRWDKPQEVPRADDAGGVARAAIRAPSGGGGTQRDPT
jgi:hypothetical protein